jgi:DNA-binding XRE family transcriptional regulator
MSIDEHRSVRWATPFGRFVRTYGVAQLAQQLQVEPAAIYQWVRGHTSPRPPTARAIVQLYSLYICLELASGKRVHASLKLDDIYAQRDLHAD